MGRDGRVGQGRGEQRIGGQITNTKVVWKSHIEIYLPTGYKTYIKI